MSNEKLILSNQVVIMEALRQMTTLISGATLEMLKEQISITGAKLRSL